MKYLLAFLILFFPLSVSAQEQTAPAPYKQLGSSFKTDEQRREGKKKQPHVEIWLPPEFQSTEQKWPLIIFSHGFGGCSRQSEFLTEYIAEQGYIVIAPDHADADCRRSTGMFGSKMQDMRAGKEGRPEKPFRSPELWTEKTESDRREDVLFALSSMLDDRRYAPYVDEKRIGLMGHSLGGYTVLGLSGAWASAKDKRFKAALAMSPYVEPYLITKGLRRIDIPVMYQGGTRDVLITPALKRTGGAYAQTPAPKYLIEFDGAGHFAWTEMETNYQLLISKVSLAFFDKYLKEKAVEIDETKTPRVRLFKKEEVAQ